MLVFDLLNMSATAPRKPAARLPRPAARYWKGKAPKGAGEVSSDDSDYDEAAEAGEAEEEGDVLIQDITGEDEEDEAEAAETQQELDLKMKEFEELMDRRPFLVNDVLIRRNPNDVQEWEKRVALWGDDDQKVSIHMNDMSTRLTYVVLSGR